MANVIQILNPKIKGGVFLNPAIKRSDSLKTLTHSQDHSLNLKRVAKKSCNV
jgi:hypothetical protein